MPENSSAAAESLAREALSAAHRAQSAADRAQNTAERALELAREAIQRIQQLERRMDALERAVEHLISMLQQEIRTLIQETRQVQQTVQTQGEAIQERVEQTTESVKEGFTTMGRQEAEKSLLLSKTALSGLVARLTIVQTTLQAVYDQAKRQMDIQKDRFTGLARKALESVNLNIGRVGAQILQIEQRDFEPPAARTRASLDGLPGAFDVAQQVGQTSLEQRAMAMAPHVEKLGVNLDDFAARRVGLVDALSPYSHPGLPLAPGLYALRVYFRGDGSGTKCLVGADATLEPNHVGLREDEEGLAKLGGPNGPFAKAWESPGAAARRQLSEDELKRLQGYLDQLHAMGAVTPLEFGIVRHHIERTAIQVLTPSVEAQS